MPGRIDHTAKQIEASRALWPLHIDDDQETVERKLRHRYPDLGLDEPRFDLDGAPLQGAPRSTWHQVVFPRVLEKIHRGEKVSHAIRHARCDALDAQNVNETVKATLRYMVSEETMRKQFYAWRKRAERQENKTTYRTKDLFDEIVFGDVSRAAEMFVRFSRVTKRKIIKNWPGKSE